MPFPNETFISQFTGALQIVAQELRQYYALMLGWLSAQHKEDGSHGNITADLLTMLAESGDGTFRGNVATSLVPTVSTVDLGATVLKASTESADHPFRNLRLSGGITFAPFSDTGVTTSSLLSRSGTALTFTFPSGSTGTRFTLAVTAGQSLTWSSLGVLTSKFLTASDSVNSANGYFERSRGTAVGEWISVAFNAADFTADAGGSWTLQSGDMSVHKYMLIGKTMFWTGWFDTTTVVGAPTVLSVAIPGGFTAAAKFLNACRFSDNGINAVGMAFVDAAGTTIGFFRSDLAALTANTNNTLVRASLVFEVQ